MAKRKHPPQDEAPGAEREASSTSLGELFEGEDLAEDFVAWLEADGHKQPFVDPLSAQGLELQARYIQQVGADPLTVLKRISINPFCKPSDRVTAAKTLLEYSRRKIPSQFEVSGKDGQAIKLDRTMLSALSPKELDTLEKLLLKAGAAAGGQDA